MSVQNIEWFDENGVRHEIMDADDLNTPEYQIRSVQIDGDLFLRFGNFLNEIGLEEVANRPDGRFLLDQIGRAARIVVQTRNALGCPDDPDAPSWGG